MPPFVLCPRTMACVTLVPALSVPPAVHSLLVLQRPSLWARPSSEYLSSHHLVHSGSQITFVHCSPELVIVTDCLRDGAGAAHPGLRVQ